MDRQTSVSPDRKTTHDGTLRYMATFNPSVVPFKRLTAYDNVGPDFKLRIQDGQLREFPLQARPTPPSRDAFWGDMTLHLHPNKASPLPSVAPDATLVSYRTRPKTRLRFFRDSAGNYWVQSKHRGAVHLIFLTDTPRRYFTPTVPVEVTAQEVPRRLRPQLPPTVRQAARKVLTHIGIRSTRFYRQLDRLVAYFRNFRPGPLPHRHENTYLDIALSQRGVCRHRSYAFMITAMALGIPTHYVTNEAHAFVEVFIPRQGWTRIDLGGASTELQVNDAKTKVLHDPGPDPFPRPSIYASGYSQLRGNIRGLPTPSPSSPKKHGPIITHLRKASSAAPLEGTRDDARDDARDGTDKTRGVRRSETRVLGHASSSNGETPTPRGPVLPGPAAPKTHRTQITIYTAAHTILRGKSLLVWGAIQARKRGVAGLRVEIYLSQDGDQAQLLGATETRALGAYRVNVLIPKGIAVGHYRLYATTPGDETHSASLSD